MPSFCISLYMAGQTKHCLEANRTRYDTTALVTLPPLMESVADSQVAILVAAYTYVPVLHTG